MTLQLRQVKIGTGAAPEEAIRIMEQEQTKIEERSGHRFFVHQCVFFIQMPAARTHE